MPVRRAPPRRRRNLVAPARSHGAARRQTGSAARVGKDAAESAFPAWFCGRAVAAGRLAGLSIRTAVACIARMASDAWMTGQTAVAAVGMGFYAGGHDFSGRHRDVAAAPAIAAVAATPAITTRASVAAGSGRIARISGRAAIPALLAFGAIPAILAIAAPAAASINVHALDRAIDVEDQIRAIPAVATARTVVAAHAGERRGIIAALGRVVAVPVVDPVGTLVGLPRLVAVGRPVRKRLAVIALRVDIPLDIAHRLLPAPDRRCVCRPSVPASTDTIGTGKTGILPTIDAALIVTGPRQAMRPVPCRRMSRTWRPCTFPAMVKVAPFSTSMSHNNATLTTAIVPRTKESSVSRQCSSPTVRPCTNSRAAK